MELLKSSIERAYQVDSSLPRVTKFRLFEAFKGTTSSSEMQLVDCASLPLEFTALSDEWFG